MTVRVAKFEPPLFLAVNRTVYVPLAVYVWAGLGALLVLPSPKSHEYVLPVPVDALENRTVRGAVPLETDVVNDATGAVTGAVTVSVYTMLFVPPALVAVRRTV